MIRLPLLALLAACAAPTDEGRGPTPIDDTGSDTAGEDEGQQRELDLASLQALLDGETTDAEGVIDSVGNGTGWPLADGEGGYWFACLCSGDGWMLTGDHEGWAGQAMEQVGDAWVLHVDIAEPDGSLYKFTDGSDWIPDPNARRYGYDDFGEYSLVEASSAHLERRVRVTDGTLRRRELRIWVPDDGAFTHTLYVHDGQNLFDPAAAWGGWALQDSLPDGVLVVGIDNTADRMSEYTHTTDTLYGDTYGGWGDQYADFVQDVVRPMVEADYGEARTVGTLGSSLGGLISFHIAHRHEGEWDFAGSMSGTMSWGSFEQNNPTMIELYEAAGHRDTALYVDSGGYGDCVDTDGDGIDDDGEGSDNYCPNLQLRDVLDDAGYTFEEDLWHWYEEGAEHDEAAWRERVWRPLEIFASL